MANPKRRPQVLNILAEIGESTNASLELDEVLPAILRAVRRLIPYAAAEITLWEDEARVLVVRAQAGDPRYTAHSGGFYRLGEGYTGWIARNKEPLLIADASRRKDIQPKSVVPRAKPIASFIGVPLLAGEDLVGTLELASNTPKTYTREHVQLLEVIGHQATAAIENARLYRRLRDERERILRAQEEVRRELARNLHDGTVQQLASIAMGLDHVRQLLRVNPDGVSQELESLQALAFRASQQARLLLFELRPVILESQGLLPALEMYLQQLSQNHSPKFHLRTPPALPRLGARVEAAVFDIIQEAVTNARKHAQAKNIRLRVSEEKDELRISIDDDGKGFDVAAVRGGYERRSSFGLLNMQERTELIDGHFSVASEVGKGTRVILRVPFRRV